VAAPGAPGHVRPTPPPVAPAPPATVKPVVAAKPTAPPVKPGAVVAKKPAAAGKPAAATPSADLASTPDPFQLPGSKDISIAQARQNALTQVVQTLPPIPDPYISNYHDNGTRTDTGAGGSPPPIAGPEDAGSNMRMAGVLYGNGIYALLETDGKTQSVQPGDTTDEGKVISIEPNAMILRTADNRLIKVSLSANPTGDQSAGYNSGM